MDLNALSSQKDRSWLLELARNAICSAIDTSIPLLNIPPSLSFFLHQERGVFVSLWVEKTLRGCLGYPFPEMSLELTVQQIALQLGREQIEHFSPQDFPSFRIQISLMTDPFSIEMDQIQIGVHGLMVNQNGQLGLLLPLAPIMYSWTIQDFLENTCLKGGLSTDTWKQKGCLYAFKTYDFSEDDL